MTLYQILHDAIHAKSGQDETLKLQYIRTEQESTMGWVCDTAWNIIYPFLTVLLDHPAI